MLVLLSRPRRSRRPLAGPEAIVLGIAQDGGVPARGLPADALRRGPPRSRPTPSRRLARPRRPGRRQALPDRRDARLRASRWSALGGLPDGILLTHAHIGHYLGLAQLGREVLGAKKVPVYCTPSMARFLREQPALEPPRRAREHRDPRDRAGRRVRAHARPPRHRVPRPAPRRGLRHRRVPRSRPGPQAPLASRHRQVGEVGPAARGLSRRPDAHGVRRRHVLLRRRDARPHRSPRFRIPLVPETMALVAAGSPEARRVVFVHLNHTNRLLWDAATPSAKSRRKGFRVAREGQRVRLSSGGE